MDDQVITGEVLREIVSCRNIDREHFFAPLLWHFRALAEKMLAPGIATRSYAA